MKISIRTRNIKLSMIEPLSYAFIVELAYSRRYSNLTVTDPIVVVSKDAEGLQEYILCMRIFNQISKNIKETHWKNQYKLRDNPKNYKHVPGYTDLIEPLCKQAVNGSYPMIQSWRIGWWNEYLIEHNLVVDLDDKEKDYIKLMANIALGQYT